MCDSLAYDFLVLLFGLSNGSAMFCTLVNRVLEEYLENFVVVYLDDIIVNNNYLEKHKEHLK